MVELRVAIGGRVQLGTYVYVEEGQDAELSVMVPVHTLDVEPLELGVVCNHVEMRQHNTLWKAGRALMDC